MNPPPSGSRDKQLPSPTPLSTYNINNAIQYVCNVYLNIGFVMQSIQTIYFVVL